jgi:tRNA G18 (ribose-2'-O)-methylase SpoU
MKETAGGERAMRELEKRVRSSTPDDPGLRATFHNLPRAPIRVICCDLDKAINHGNILRVAECFRLEEVLFAPTAKRKEQDFSGGFAALKWQPYSCTPTLDAVAKAKADGYRIYGLSINPRAVAIRKLEWEFPCALVLGRELEGIDPDVEDLCDELVAIPLYGMVQSLNVATCFAIAAEHAIAAYCEREPAFLPARSVASNLTR